MDKEKFKKIWNLCRPATVLVSSILIVVFAIWLVCTIFIHKYISPVDKNDATPVEFIISDGWGASTIAKHLYEACGENQPGLIRNKAVFKVYVDFIGKSKDLQAGKYYLSKNMDIPTIIDTLCKGGESLNVKKITIPEGTTVEGIVKILKDSGMYFDSKEFLDLCKKGEKFTNYEFVNNVVKANESARTYALEGYLFPDTYDLYIDASSQTIINKMLSRFNSVCYGGENSLYNKAKAKGLSMDEAIALASVIEKEAVLDKDFYRVSAVFHNRLKIDMPLQSDAPLAYLFKTTDTVTFTQEQMNFDSPYNTHVYKGVPIGAICNPGKLAITAALTPDEEFVAENYLYFCFTDHETNENVYAKTYEEHQANVERYRPNW